MPAKKIFYHLRLTPFELDILYHALAEVSEADVHECFDDHIEFDTIAIKMSTILRKIEVCM